MVKPKPVKLLDLIATFTGRETTIVLGEKTDVVLPPEVGPWSVEEIARRLRGLADQLEADERIDKTQIEAD